MVLGHVARAVARLAGPALVVRPAEAVFIIIVLCMFLVVVSFLLCY